MAIRKGKIGRRKVSEIPIDDDLLSRVVREAFAQANQDVNRKLDNKAKLGSLIPLGFFTWGMIELFRNPHMPKWNELLWYSYTIFQDYNSQKLKQGYFSPNGKEKFQELLAKSRVTQKAARQELLAKSKVIQKGAGKDSSSLN